MNDPLIEPLTEAVNETLDPLEELNLRLAVAATDIAELRAEVARLDRDLDESRRLNLRAAELLDLVYEHLSGAPGPGTAAPEVEASEIPQRGAGT
ncbi:DUF6752 domain-containing protein [Arthrobacter sp. MPF02]|uniref:DUF6752 domain-containing protein n=1 Tax=Arthrobacter sp. MPF02 TaxID=3388492 RepID=UPI003984D7B2